MNKSKCNSAKQCFCELEMNPLFTFSTDKTLQQISLQYQVHLIKLRFYLAPANNISPSQISDVIKGERTRDTCEKMFWKLKECAITSFSHTKFKVLTCLLWACSPLPCCIIAVWCKLVNTKKSSGSVSLLWGSLSFLFYLHTVPGNTQPPVQTHACVWLPQILLDWRSLSNQELSRKMMMMMMMVTCPGNNCKQCEANTVNFKLSSLQTWWKRNSHDNKEQDESKSVKLNVNPFSN